MKVGDRVQFKSWDEMFCQYGLNGEDIDCECGFIEEMRHLCSTSARIEYIDIGSIGLKDFSTDGDTVFMYSLDMIKPCDELESLKTRKKKLKANIKKLKAELKELKKCEKLLSGE